MTEQASTTYVLGTDADELVRLRDQHLIWKEDTIALWRRAAIIPGNRVLEVGSGPGFASADLCEIVGQKGHVTAVERSLNYINACNDLKSKHAFHHLSVNALDVMTDPLPPGPYDASWCRWVCSFLPNPEVLIAKLSQVIKPGGHAIFAEYVDYASWRMLPEEPIVDEFVKRVVNTWKDTGSIADAAPLVLAALQKFDFEIIETRPRLFCCKPGDSHWTWVTDYMKVNTARNLAAGIITAGWAQDFLEMLEHSERVGTYRMMTPTLLEIIARKR